MKRKIITILLAAMVLTGTVVHPITEIKVMATPPTLPEIPPKEDIIQSGEYRYSYYSYGVKIKGYNGKGGDVVIPESIGGKTVVCIESMSNTNLTGVVIPKTVSEIKPGAFAYCENLERIQVDANNTYYTEEDNILYDKSKKTLVSCATKKTGSVIIPEGVTKIDSLAFHECSALTSITIPKSVIDYGKETFVGCSSLKSITIPKGLASISGEDFAFCSSLEEIIVDKDHEIYASKDGLLYSKGFGHLWYCPEGKTGKVEIAEGTSTIDMYAFENCPKVTGIKIPNGMNYFSVSNYSLSGLEEIEVAKNNATYTSENGILYNKEKTKVLNCPAGKTGDMVIPDGVADIASGAFNYCNKIKSISIPKSLNNIEFYGSMFFGCDSLEKINVDKNNSHYMSENGILYSKDKTKLLCCPAKKSGTVKIPKQVSSIQERAFLDCANLENIMVDENNKNYASIDGILYDKAKTKMLCCPVGKTGKISIPEGVVSLNTFTWCDKLTSIDIPSTADKLKGEMFRTCSGLKSINVHEDNKNYTSENGILYNKNKKKLLRYPNGKAGEVNIKNGVTSIEEEAFSNGDNFTKIVIPNTVTIIASNAFEDCDGLTEVHIPNSVTRIEKNAFDYCNNLKNIYYEGDNIKWNQLVDPEKHEYLYRASIHFGEIKETTKPTKQKETNLEITIDGKRVQGTTKVKVKKSYDLGSILVSENNQTEKVAVSWKSSNKKIATVTADGIVKIKKKGTVKITATAANGKSKTITLKAVNKKIKVKKLSVDGDKTMKPKTSQKLTLKVTPATADNQKVTWKSSNKKIATVNKKGNVKAKKKGTVKITAKATDGSKKKAVFKIKIK